MKFTSRSSLPVACATWKLAPSFSPRASSSSLSASLFRPSARDMTNKASSRRSSTSNSRIRDCSAWSSPSRKLTSPLHFQTLGNTLSCSQYTHRQPQRSNKWMTDNELALWPAVLKTTLCIGFISRPPIAEASNYFKKDGQHEAATKHQDPELLQPTLAETGIPPR
jgi:hypothetical protein